MTSLSELLNSRPVILRGALIHKYLKNTLLRPSESDAAGRFRERPELVQEMTSMLREIQDTFIDGYDPGVFVRELSSLQSLSEEERRRLLGIVQHEFQNRFQPEQRLDSLKKSAEAFVNAFRIWHRHVSDSGVNGESELLWASVRGSAAMLRDCLADQELSTRWIP